MQAPPEESCIFQHRQDQEKYVAIALTADGSQLACCISSYTRHLETRPTPALPWLENNAYVVSLWSVPRKTCELWEDLSDEKVSWVNLSRYSNGGVEIPFKRNLEMATSLAFGNGCVVIGTLGGEVLFCEWVVGTDPHREPSGEHD